jgi:hypothetical protein
MFFVNQRHRVLEDSVATAEAYARLPDEARFKVHTALAQDLDLIDAFAAENPFNLNEADLDVVRSWKHMVVGRFYILRELKSHTIFLSATEPVVAYGVLALSEPFGALLGRRLPLLAGARLLPFRGRIVYDGILALQNIVSGGGVKRRLEESYRQAKDRLGVVMSLPIAEGQSPRTKPRAGRKTQLTASPSVGGGAETRQAHERIVKLTDAFCEEHLDAEFAALCRKLAGVLARKRPSPLASGKPESWASGIVRAIGWVNFLDDPSQPHHMRLMDIGRLLGVSEATSSAKSMAIRRLHKLHPLDPEWTVPSQTMKNPMAWMVSVNGLIVDARSLPRATQEELYLRGLIPFVPEAGS